MVNEVDLDQVVGMVEANVVNRDTLERRVVVIGDAGYVGLDNLSGCGEYTEYVGMVGFVSEVYYLCGGCGCSGRYRYGRSTLSMVNMKDMERRVRWVYCILLIWFKR